MSSLFVPAIAPFTMDPLPKSNMELNHRFNGDVEHIHKPDKDPIEQREREVRPTKGLDVRCTASVKALKSRPRLTLVQRYIPFLPTIAFDATLQSSWEALSVSFQAGLLNGGPVRNPHELSSTVANILTIS